MKNFKGWVRGSDLWDGKLKKVVGCWPVKRFKHEVGDAVLEIAFKSDGSGVIITGAEGYSPKPVKPTKVRAYISQGIVQINTADRRQEYVSTAGLHPVDHKLYPHGSLDFTTQELFDIASLNGCKEIPTVQ